MSRTSLTVLAIEDIDKVIVRVAWRICYSVYFPEFRSVLDIVKTVQNQVYGDRKVTALCSVNSALFHCVLCIFIVSSRQVHQPWATMVYCNYHFPLNSGILHMLPAGQ